jgi:hypothetical protein
MDRANVKTMFSPNVKLLVQLPLLRHVTHGHLKSKCNSFFWEIQLWYKFVTKIQPLHHKFTKFHRFVQNLVFIIFYKNCTNSMLLLIWMKFLCIQYFKYLNRWDIIFEWHIWMFKFNIENHIFYVKFHHNNCTNLVKM